MNASTPAGRLVFHFFTILAEFERNVIRERTRAGLAAARARGRKGGRPKVLPVDKQRIAQALRDDPTQGIASICKTLEISRSTFYRYTKAKETE